MAHIRIQKDYGCINPDPRSILAGYPYGTTVERVYKNTIAREIVCILNVPTKWLLDRIQPFDVDAQQDIMEYS